jgi:hypothetical protein
MIWDFKTSLSFSLCGQCLDRGTTSTNRKGSSGGRRGYGLIFQCIASFLARAANLWEPGQPMSTLGLNLG